MNIKNNYKSIGLYIHLFAIFLILSSLSYADDTIKKCEDSRGIWIIPVSDEKENEKREPFCQCLQGHKLLDGICVKIDDETLCTASDGKWEDNSCLCPKDSTGWKDNFGCDYVHSIKEANENGLLYITLIAIAIIVLLIILFFLLKKLLKLKRKK